MIDIEKLKQSDLKVWKKEITKINPDLFPDLIEFSSSQYDPTDWKEKLHLLISTINDPSILEVIGKKISLEQLHEILILDFDHLAQIPVEKFASIFTGVSPSLFFGLIVRISKEQISLLQKIASSPSIEYHLSILSHTVKDHFNSFSKKIRDIENILLKNDPAIINANLLNQLHDDISEIYFEAFRIIHVCNLSLSIVWNSNRTDILQELGTTKELCHKCLLNDIGHLEQEDELDRHLIPPTGLWKLWEDLVDDFFSVPSAKGLSTKIHNDDPAFEALNIFALWHLEDYHEIGLLKGVPLSTIHELDNVKDLDSNLNKKQALFDKIRENLSNLGLKTLKDLKREHIFSKQALIDYISSIQN